MCNALGVLLLGLAHIAKTNAHGATKHQSVAMIPYVAPENSHGKHNGGIVIIDNRRGETEVPFVEVYGGMAYNYENPEDYDQNYLTRRQKTLEKQTEFQPDAYDIIRTF